MRSPFRPRLLSVALPAALLLAACGSDAPTTPPSAAAGAPSSGSTGAGQPVTGGTLRFALDRDPTCLDPQQQTLTASVVVTRTLVDSLTDQDRETGEIEPWLASSWEISPDGRVYTFTIRDGVTFSDGTPLTAEVVKANFERIQELGAKAQIANGYLAGAQSIEVVDGNRLQVTFEQPNAPFLQATSTQSLGILAPSTLAADPADVCLGQDLIGSGPFTLTDYTPDEAVRIAARDDYGSASGLRGHEGRPYLDGVEFTFVSEPGVRAGLLTSDQVDAYLTVSPQDESVLTAAGLDIISHVNEGHPYHFQANTTSPVLADPAVRQAIQIGFDRKEITDTVLTPTHGVATGALSSSSPAYLDLSEALTHRPDAARQLLDDAGWTVGADGVRERDGQQLRVRVFFYQGHEQVIQLVQQRLAEIGIALDIKQVTTAEGADLLASGDYDLFQSSGTRADGDILRQVWSPSQRNVAQLPADDELGVLLDGQAAEIDPDARQELLDQAQRLLIEQGYEIPLYQYVIVVGAAPDVHGLGVDTSPRDWFYDAWVA
ncbi:ABC transporter substrate-binding protein [Nakamurella leprariae]|uniref:ABC transporter substrate-binding protein n=1 Tax=Nakamurella leprariae TaxID=2803911 RepID=A0A938YF61_9ACTN|nr:ABC transporter substrate-binding protein [Nakamurella leprariae]MBM9466715.1 ABC transporter substrate-binding protein [Nakamurella leprariae]